MAAALTIDTCGFDVLLDEDDDALALASGFDTQATADGHRGVVAIRQESERGRRCVQADAQRAGDLGVRDRGESGLDVRAAESPRTHEFGRIRPMGNPARGPATFSVGPRKAPH